MNIHGNGKQLDDCMNIILGELIPAYQERDDAKAEAWVSGVCYVLRQINSDSLDNLKATLDNMVIEAQLRSKMK